MTVLFLLASFSALIVAWGLYREAQANGVRRSAALERRFCPG